MDSTLAAAWLLSLAAEIGLTLRVRPWRPLYRRFYQYLLFDVLVSIALFGFAELHWGDLFTKVWMAAMVLQIFFRGVVFYEACRRMHKRIPFHLASVIVVAGSSAIASLWLFFQLQAERRWPDSWLEIVYALRAGADCFLACVLTGLTLLPSRLQHVFKVEGRHSIILSIYLWMCSAAYFSVTTTKVSVKLMWIVGACFAIWAWSFRRPRGLA